MTPADAEQIESFFRKKAVLEFAFPNPDGGKEGGDREEGEREKEEREGEGEGEEREREGEGKRERE